MKRKLHSEEYFGDQRNYWWNKDFLQLMADRWQLDRFCNVLDAGCGIGHWGQLLAPYFSKNCEVLGIDAEPTWVDKARQRVQKLGLTNYRYEIGDIRELTFSDASFDLITCQTVLIHVENPLNVLQEFFRVLRPGGMLAVAEPNNSAATMVRSSVCFSLPVDEIVDSVRFHMICERGKAALGQGHNSVGDLLPGYFSISGFSNVRTYLSDKASSLIPPYTTEEEKVMLHQIEDLEDRNIWFGDRNESQRYFLAGGGSQAEFNQIWNKVMCVERHRNREARRYGKFHTAGGGIFYLISGIKN